MNLFGQLLLGGFMLGLTVMTHAMALDFIIKRTAHTKNTVSLLFQPFWRPVMASLIVVSSFVSHIFQIWLWAFLYYIIGAEPLESFSETLYFSTVTYTTLGANTTLEPSFRMLSAVEGANGFLLFGWTTAFIFEVIAQLYKHETMEL